MEKMIAFCGLSCTDCPTFLATQANDDEARKKTADMMEKKYGLVFKPEEINCDGCLSKSGVLIGYCSTCKVRACGMEKGVENCTACKAHPNCDHLAEFHSFSPDAKAMFDRCLKERQV
ncbi:MAG: DUF3795 domain-containing protein [Desulfobacterales bacterium]|nr:DUF3795 domain-containing protein [Desulfobacterales bacterium]